LIRRNPEQPDGEIPGHHDEHQEQNRPNPRCVQRPGNSSWAFRLHHASLPDRSVSIGRFRPQINLLDKYCLGDFGQDALEYAKVGACHTHNCHHPRKRVIQYSRAGGDRVDRPRRTGSPPARGRSAVSNTA
jgi:hypothetical protein